MTIARYLRTGGGSPGFDEQLEVADDGSFRMSRQVSADRAGRFAGTLDAATVEQLRSALGNVNAPISVDPGMPGAVIEVIEWTGGTATFPFEDELGPEWERVRDVLQNLVEELKQFPVAALELRLDDGGDTATFQVVGAEPVAARLAGARVELSLFDEDEDYLDSVTVPLPAELGGSGPLQPGWQAEVPLDHGLPFTPKRTLQATVDFTLDGRGAQLLCTAGKGWF